MQNQTAVAFDKDLMARYGESGPRYTSYPTALQFVKAVTTTDYHLAASWSDGALTREPLAIYVHVPYCISPYFYCVCNKSVTQRIAQTEAYTRDLVTEIALRSRYFDSHRTIEQLHLGGGTPTFMLNKQLIEIIEKLDDAFELTDKDTRDYSIEIDPRVIDSGILKLAKALGFNRISLGVPDLDTAVQRAVNRFQPLDTVTRAYMTARELGFRSINFDLIYGVPIQTRETFVRTLAQVIEMRPDRLSVHGYAHMPQAFKAQPQLRTDALPEPQTRLAFQQIAIDMLTAAGYDYIGMDHFALPGDSLAQAKRDWTLHRSFQGYTTHADRDLVSFGVSAIGRVGGMYVQNHKSLADYRESIADGVLPSQRGAWMDYDDLIRRDVIQQVMCHGKIDIVRIEARHNISFSNYFAGELRRLTVMVIDGLIVMTSRQIALTPKGLLLMSSVAMVFDAYLKYSQPRVGTKAI